MTYNEAKQIFLSRGYVEVEGGKVYDANKWRESCRVISDWLEQEPCDDAISRKSIKQKLQEHHDFFVNAYGGFSNLPRNDKSRVDEISNCIAMVVNEPPVNQQPKKSSENMSGVGIEIAKTEETKESEIKYLNINVSNSEVDRNPDIVRLCADVGIEEYVKPKTGHWIRWYEQKETDWYVENIPHCKCSECGKEYDPHSSQFIKYCNECGAKMVEPQESESNK